MSASLLAKFPLLRAFEYAHLPDHLQAVSKPFYDQAWQVAERSQDTRFSGMETSACLRHLREAKDCAVTAMLVV